MVEEETPSFLAEKWKEANVYYKATGFKLPFKHFLLLLALFGLAVGALLILFLRDPILSIIAFISRMSLSVSIPLTIRNNRVDAVPDRYSAL